VSIYTQIGCFLLLAEHDMEMQEQAHVQEGEGQVQGVPEQAGFKAQGRVLEHGEEGGQVNSLGIV
jgi:hypothetical protein